MSYYILPKSSNYVTINPIVSRKPATEPLYISQSLHIYYNETKELLIKMCINERDSSLNVYAELIKLINPYEYIFSKVPGSKSCVSKLKSRTNVFYELLEVTTILCITEDMPSRNIKSLHIGKNCADSMGCFEFHQDCDKNYYSYNSSKINNELYKNTNDVRFDYIFFEIDRDNALKVNSYVVNLLRILMIIFKNQANDGVCIIKIDTLFHKPVIDILYIMSAFYEKMCIIKPNTSNVTTFEKYIVCRKFILDEKKIEACKDNYNNICAFLKQYNGGNISSLINDEIPSYFLNKVNDINIIIGQQQLESLDQIINTLNNKNKHDKIELLKKAGIQKSVNWCEKYDIPCNKFSDKTNIFLPLDEFDNNVCDEVFN